MFLLGDANNYMTGKRKHDVTHVNEDARLFICVFVFWCFGFGGFYFVIILTMNE